MQAQLRQPLHGPAQEGRELPAGLGILNPRFAEERFPWPQVWGYLASLALTFVALYLVERHRLAPGALGAVVLVLAGGQAATQLGVFMHVRESRGPAWQLVPLGLAFAIAIALVGLSVWVMAFKWGVA
jgi:cytochrome aa3-600 menaquinol oxidase subunit 4